MEKRLLVLYRDPEMKQSWCIYAGGTEEADGEIKITREGAPNVIEVARIWINTEAKVEFWNDK